MNLNLRVLNKFGNPAPLNSPTEIRVEFPYETAEYLVKKMTSGDVRILNDGQGEIQVMLSDFDIQGMTKGARQSFRVVIESRGMRRVANFKNLIDVIERGGKKSLELPTLNPAHAEGIK